MLLLQDNSKKENNSHDMCTTSKCIPLTPKNDKHLISLNIITPETLMS